MPTNARATRRRLLAAGLTAGVGALAGCSGGQSDSGPANETEASNGTASGTGNVSVETVVSISGDEQPENLAFDGDGNLYFGLTSGGLHRLARDRLGSSHTLADTEQIATLPKTTGVEVSDDGAVYVAVPTDTEQGGIWEVPPDGEAAQLATIGGFPNGVFADGDRLLVTESFDGRVFAVGTDGKRSTWLDDDRLDPTGFGANGITRSAAGDVYVAVTEATDDTGRVLRVPVADDGSAGEPVVFAEGSTFYGADGMTAHDGRRFLAVNHRQQVLELTAEGEPEPLATAENGLVYPSDVVVGQNGTHLYLCDLATGSRGAAGIYRIEA